MSGPRIPDPNLVLEVLWMNRLLSIVLVALSVTALSGISLAQENRAKLTRPTDARLFPLEDLRPGMKGVGHTVFAGAKPEEFGVEILGALPGFPGPHKSAIIARLTGSNVEKTGVFAGMSGSPVFVDGRLIGAVAFSFPFSKEPIAGITPIKEMIDIFEQGPGNQTEKLKEPRSVSFAQLAATDWKLALPKPPFSGGALIAPVSAGSALMPLFPTNGRRHSGRVRRHHRNAGVFSSELVANGLLPLPESAAQLHHAAGKNEKTLLPGTLISVN